MGVLDRFLNSMKFNDDEDYDDDFMDDEDEVLERRSRFSGREAISLEDEDGGYRRRAKITKMPTNRKNASFSNKMGVVVVKVQSVEDGQAIIDTLLENRTCVVNLEGIGIDIAQRVMDITFGANVALDGHLQQISKNIFIVTPRSVDISGDFSEGFGVGQFDMFAIAK